ncbi:type IV secretion system protein VirB3 [Sphingobium sp. R-21]|uniref:type IV secretion system protein VirB3 n=1 Tax=Sphingobium sp. R-21 TaxID=3404056 RepID=UPI003CF3C740
MTCKMEDALLEEREEIARDTLFLGLTRPALWAGIPIEAAVPILLVSAIVLIGTNNPVYALVMAAVSYGLARLVVRQDVNAFRLMFLFFRTKAASRNRVFWGGSSYTPLPLKGIARKGFGRHE